MTNTLIAPTALEIDDELAPLPDNHPFGRDGLQSMQETAEKAAELLRSIGSSHRLLMLCLLTEGPKTVTEICDASGMRQSLASQHLARLRLDGLVSSQRQGHFVHYSLANPVARDIIAVLYRHLCGANAQTATATDATESAP
ncbi:MAG: helix-turn-helix transcriptional regulator [Hyphomicrobiaceae bacterium]|nr:helix-turn-helix transcriptional regulator [Hyphomicrobiaceae bacterium]